MKTTRVARVIAAVVLMVLFAQQPGVGAQPMENVSDLVKALGHALMVKERVRQLEEIEKITRNLDPSIKLDECDVLAVAVFLDTENRETVHFAAMILGNFGKRATVAIPYLERSMERLDAEEDQLLIKPAQPFATQIYVALSKIDGRPIPREMGAR